MCDYCLSPVRLVRLKSIWYVHVEQTKHKEKKNWTISFLDDWNIRKT